MDTINLVLAGTTALFFIASIVIFVFASKKEKKLVNDISNLNTETSRAKSQQYDVQKTLNIANENLKKNKLELVTVSSRTLTLQKFSKEINSTFEISSILNKVSDSLVSITDATKLAIYLYEKVTNTITSKKTLGFPEDTELTFSQESGWFDFLIENKSPITKENIEKDYTLKAMYEEEECQFQLLSPLIHMDEFIGVIKIFETKTKPTKDTLRLISIISDLTTLAMKNAILFKTIQLMAITDGLTGLFNHRIFQMHLKKEIEKSKQSKKPVTFFITDIDHFKSFNDTYGHQVGDYVLEETAKIIKETVGSNDFVARYGGEEFGVVYSNTSKEQAFGLADNIRQKVADKVYPHENTKLRVTISIGVATYPEDAIIQGDLIKLADLALYRAKENGRNQVQLTSAEDIEELLAEKNKSSS